MRFFFGILWCYETYDVVFSFFLVFSFFVLTQ